MAESSPVIVRPSRSADHGDKEADNDTDRDPAPSDQTQKLICPHDSIPQLRLSKLWKEQERNRRDKRDYTQY
jgi:hypothetical protein